MEIDDQQQEKRPTVDNSNSKINIQILNRTPETDKTDEISSQDENDTNDFFLDEKQSHETSLGLDVVKLPDDSNGNNEQTLKSISNDIQDNVNSLMHRSQWKIKKIQRKKLKDDLICSICLRKPFSKLTDSKSSGPLVRSCYCLGLKSHQHENCINQWLEETGLQKCPYCHFYYNYEQKQKTFLDFMREFDLYQDWAFYFCAFLFSIYIFSIGSLLSYSMYKFRDMPLQQYHLSLYITALFWLTTFMFALAIISTSVDFAITQYIKYKYWRQTNYSIKIVPVVDSGSSERRPGSSTAPEPESGSAFKTEPQPVPVNRDN